MEKNVFSYRGAKSLNSLPAECKLASSMNMFKQCFTELNIFFLDLDFEHYTLILDCNMALIVCLNWLDFCLDSCIH